MSSPDRRNKIIALAIGVMVLLAPVVIIVLTIGVLVMVGDLVLGNVSPIVFLELYLLDLALFAGFAYGLYRLMLRLFEHQLPASLDALEIGLTDEEPNDRD